MYAADNHAGRKGLYDLTKLRVELVYVFFFFYILVQKLSVQLFLDQTKSGIFLTHQNIFYFRLILF